MAEVEASSKNLRKLPECNIQFQIMLFESLSHSYFSNGITCVAVQPIAVSVEPRPSVQPGRSGELLKVTPLLLLMATKM